MKKWKIIAPLFLAVTFITGLAVGKFLTAYNDAHSPISAGSSSQKIASILQLIEDKYVDNVDKDSLTNDAISKILSELDPHSVYISAEDLQTANDDLEGSFSGIGVQFNIQSDTVMVIAVIHGGPSEKVGLQPGDRIISVNDTNFVGKAINEDKVVHTLKGPKGTKVKVGIKRASSPKPLYYTIVRGDVPVKSVDVSYMLTPEIGYIKVSTFGAQTYNEFLTAIAKLKRQNAKKIVIDLRGNSGGYLTTACNMINEFLKKGDLIVYTQGEHSRKDEEYADGTGTCQDMPVAVLIDEWSASASEIFAGAIQDNDRGTIIGRRSFGKGLVQQQYPLSDGSAIRLTIGRYYTPSGRCIQKPYKKGDLEDYETDILNRYLHGEFISRDSISTKNLPKFKTVKKGRTVYGGGGITADIFIPRDTSGYTPYFNKLTNSGVLYEFAFRYADSNREKLKKQQSCEQLNSYLRQQSLLKDVTKYAEKKGIKMNIPQMLRSQKLIEETIHAYIARNIDDTDLLFYQTVNSTDKAILSAVNTLKSQK